MAVRLEWLKEIATHNWNIKLLAVLLATVSFYAIRGATNFEVPYDIPLKVEVADGIAILDQPKTVCVTFRGSQEDLRRLSQKDIKAVIRPKATDPAGAEQVTVSSRDVQGAASVRVVNVEPKTVTIAFDHEVEKDMPVAKPKTIGTPLMGKVDLDYEPRKVKIRGSNLRLQNKAEVSTEPVDVDGRVESFTRRVRVLSPGDTQVVSIEPAEITVNVKIVTESVSRELSNVVVVALMKPARPAEATIRPDRVTVTLHGRPEAVESAVSNAVTVFADCTGLPEGGETNVPVNVYLPLHTDVDAAVHPSTVNVMLKGK